MFLEHWVSSPRPLAGIQDVQNPLADEAGGFLFSTLARKL